MRTFDAHAHLPLDGDDCRLGLPACVCATCEDEFPRLANLFSTYKEQGLVPAFGLHPWFIKGRSPNWNKTLREYLEAFPQAQVGEIGIDKTKSSECGKEEQFQIFETQLDLAVEFERKAIIHVVSFWGDLMHCLRSRKKLPRMLFHRFSGSKEIARELLKLGAKFSFSNSKLEKEETIALTLPQNSVLAESDLPLGKISRKACEKNALALKKFFT